MRELGSRLELGGQVWSLPESHKQSTLFWLLFKAVSIWFGSIAFTVAVENLVLKSYSIGLTWPLIFYECLIIIVGHKSLPFRFIYEDKSKKWKIWSKTSESLGKIKQTNEHQNWKRTRT